MHIAILGGGMQGCCIALALAARGARVTLYDKNDAVLSRAAVANEGRIHLGHIYAGDPSFATAKLMIQGALSFGPFFERYLGLAPDDHEVSEPTSYVVHRQSHRGAADVAAYFAAIHTLLTDAVAGTNMSYFGRELPAPRQWSSAEIETAFDPELVVAAFDTPESAIEPHRIASLIRDAMAADPRIDLAPNRAVQAVDASDDRPTVISRDADGGEERSTYDHVVNALWDGRLAVDATVGLTPKRAWINRFKYGIRFRPPPGLPPLPTIAILLGPFGEMLTYKSGWAYASWYPACMRGIAFGAETPDLPMHPGEPLKSEIIAGTLDGLGEVVPMLRDLDPAALDGAVVIGGVIVAPGSTDIPDPESELHARHGMGVATQNRYHSVYPGKLTLAPYFADMCAERIVAS